jgi:hypothetical protein
MSCNRLLRLIKELHSKRQKEPRKTTEETSGCVRPERVNKWPKSLIMMMIMMKVRDENSVEAF